MKKIILFVSLFVFTFVQGSYAQNIHTLLEYTKPISSNSKKSFTLDIRGKGYARVKIECKVDQQNVVMYYKTSTMNSYKSISTTGLPALYNYYYHKTLFVLSASVQVKGADYIRFIVENKSDKETSIQLTVYGLTGNTP
ncbi:MAG: hypothetical protein M1381_02115 [Deltaproteobacteria bacterium]|nr:hypothetical protein [Deltaproteobacteria bacterium]MCL5792064.1 hypothetical protein [Deltaproteobacteria bacterium]